jgi:hypothetical protein
MVVVLRAFGTTVLADPVDTVLRFFNDHRLVTTGASVSLVMAWLILQKLTGHDELPSISELEADLAAEDEPDSEVEQGVQPDGHPGPGGDRLHREDDAG